MNWEKQLHEYQRTATKDETVYEYYDQPVLFRVPSENKGKHILVVCCEEYGGENVTLKNGDQVYIRETEIWLFVEMTEHKKVMLEKGNISLRTAFKIVEPTCEVWRHIVDVDPNAEHIRDCIIQMSEEGIQEKWLPLEGEFLNKGSNMAKAHQRTENQAILEGLAAIEDRDARKQFLNAIDPQILRNMASDLNLDIPEGIMLGEEEIEKLLDVFERTDQIRVRFNAVITTARDNTRGTYGYTVTVDPQEDIGLDQDAKTEFHYGTMKEAIEAAIDMTARKARTRIADIVKKHRGFKG